MSIAKEHKLLDLFESKNSKHFELIAIYVPFDFIDFSFNLWMFNEFKACNN
jgi:hypothetical protein